jgi:hypothetical protein
MSETVADDSDVHLDAAPEKDSDLGFSGRLGPLLFPACSNVIHGTIVCKQPVLPTIIENSNNNGGGKSSFVG